MFSPTTFEKRVYAFVTKEVNSAFSALISEGIAQQEVFKMQRQMMEALHSVTEETVTQISYSLMLGRTPATLFRYGSHVFETVILEDSTTLLVCRNCKQSAVHDATQAGQHFEQSVLKLGKQCQPDQP